MKISSIQRQMLNSKIMDAGFDGLIYFPSVGSALNKLGDLLAREGFEIPLILADEVSGPEGGKNFDFFRSFKDRTEEVSNSMMVFHWYQLPSGNFEVTVYCS